jgi:Leucine Rich repeat
MTPQPSGSSAPRLAQTKHREPRFVRRLQRNDPSLKDLDLTKLKVVPHHTAIALAESLEGNSKLKHLWLENCKIDDEVARALANSLSKNKVLETLVLGHNGITDEGMRELAETLKKNGRLKMLSIWKNRITDKGVAHLAEALKENQSLETLCLSKNPITDVGAKALEQSLQSNESLTRISLEDSDVTLPMRSRLEALLRDRNCGLELLQDTTTNSVTTAPDNTSSTDDGESEKTRAEIEYEIKRLAEFCESAMKKFDEETWRQAGEAEKRRAQLVVDAARYPSAEQLKDMIKDIEVSLNSMSPSDPNSFPLVRKLTFFKKQLDRELEKENEIRIRHGRKIVLSALEASDPATVDGLTQPSIVPKIPMEYLAIITDQWKKDAVIDRSGNGTVFKGSDTEGRVVMAIKRCSNTCDLQKEAEVRSTENEGLTSKYFDPVTNFECFPVSHDSPSREHYPGARVFHRHRTKLHSVGICGRWLASLNSHHYRTARKVHSSISSIHSGSTGSSAGLRSF